MVILSNREGGQCSVSFRHFQLLSGGGHERAEASKVRP